MSPDLRGLIEGVESAAIFQKIPVLWEDFYSKVLPHRKRWEGYEKIAKAIFGHGELSQAATVKEYLTVQTEGSFVASM